MTTATTIAWDVISRTNGRPFSRCQIGWYIVSEARDVDQFGEYAADYWTCRIEAGRYPLYAYRECGSRWHSLGVDMPGVIVSGSWWNRLTLGVARSVRLSPRAYDVAKLILGGEGDAYELLGGVEARPIHYEYQGAQKTTHGLFADDQQF